MKKAISLILTLVMLTVLGIPAFADVNSYYYAESWDELVEFLDDLDDGDGVYIEMAADRYGDVHPKGDTACISADNVELVFGGLEEFWEQGNAVDGPLFEVTGDGVTLDFNGVELQSKDDSAIVVDGDDCRIINATFSSCKNKGGYGGAIYISDNDPGCQIIACGFDSCQAKYGGAVYIDADNATIDHCDFKKCTSEKKDPTFMITREKAPFNTAQQTIRYGANLLPMLKKW